PFAAQHFDLVFTMMTLHHIPDTEAILKRFHHVLKDRGHLCVADLDREDGSFHGAGFTGHLGFDREALRSVALGCGFGPIVFDTVYRIGKTVSGAHRKFPVFLMTAEKSPD
ncbi:MAG: class I SAM-dependent methyltransferase, partial [Gammaproteobacteria bacterium]|nr:class I SAM-dependent methyltransferase [Gammaproteobacteria bacterium]